MTLQLILIITLTVLTIGSQVPNVYFVFNEFNSYKGKMKIAQSGTFCGIISLAILYYALSGQHWMAMGGAVIEIILNLWYYAANLTDPKYTNNKGERVTDWGEKIKKQWPAYFLAILLPSLIFIFSMELGKLYGV